MQFEGCVGGAAPDDHSHLVRVHVELLASTQDALSEVTKCFRR